MHRCFILDLSIILSPAVCVFRLAVPLKFTTYLPITARTCIDHNSAPDRHCCPIPCQSFASGFTETAEATSAVARHLLLLESKMDQQQHTGKLEGREGSGVINETKGDGATVRERLALLLQVLYLTTCIDGSRTMVMPSPLRTTIIPMSNSYRTAT